MLGVMAAMVLFLSSIHLNFIEPHYVPGPWARCQGPERDQSQFPPSKTKDWWEPKWTTITE